MKNIYCQPEKIRKENLLLYVLIFINIAVWGLAFYIKLADHLHDFGTAIGKGFAGKI